MALDEQRCYDILKLDGPIDGDLLRKRYRELAQRYHPDKNPSGEERFKEINAAYHYLLERLEEGPLRGPAPKKKRRPAASKSRDRGQQRARSAGREKSARARADGDQGKEQGQGKEQPRPSSRAEKAAAYRAWRAQHAEPEEPARAQGKKSPRETDETGESRRESTRERRGARDDEGALLRGSIQPSIGERLASLRGQAQAQLARFSEESGARIGQWLRSRRWRRRARGPLVRLRLPIDLQTLLYGAQQRVAINRPVRCERCAGKGVGCAICEGSGRTLKRVELRVEIPPGAETKQRLSFPGEGGEGLDGAEDGDLELILDPPPLTGYRRSGAELQMTLLVPPKLLSEGGQVQVKLLRGLFRLEIPKGSFSGRTLRVEGQGLPRPKGPPGDLKITLRPAIEGR